MGRLGASLKADRKESRMTGTIKSNRSSSLNLSGVNVAILKRWLENIPSKATLRVQVTPGDRPFDSGSESLTASWTEDIGSPDGA